MLMSAICSSIVGTARGSPAGHGLKCRARASCASACGSLRCPSADARLFCRASSSWSAGYDASLQELGDERSTPETLAPTVWKADRRPSGAAADVHLRLQPVQFVANLLPRPLRGPAHQQLPDRVGDRERALQRRFVAVVQLQHAVDERAARLLRQRDQLHAVWRASTRTVRFSMFVRRRVERLAQRRHRIAAIAADDGRELGRSGNRRAHRAVLGPEQRDGPVRRLEVLERDALDVLRPRRRESDRGAERTAASRRRQSIRSATARTDPSSPGSDR